MHIPWTNISQVLGLPGFHLSSGTGDAPILDIQRGVSRRCYPKSQGAQAPGTYHEVGRDSVATELGNEQADVLLAILAATVCCFPPDKPAVTL